jgi:hypothetical protein
MKDIGEYGEVCFLKEALSRGYTIGRPYGDNASYDFFLDTGDRILRIQVKCSATPINKSGSYKLQLSKGSKSKQPYTKEDIDYIVAVLLPNEIYYFIPVERLRGRKTTILSPLTGLSENEVFRERWDFLEKDPD